MDNTWVVVVDNILTKVYAGTENGKEIKLTKQIDGFENRPQKIAVNSNSPGHYQLSESTQNEDVQANANQEHIACELAEFLETNYLQHKYNSLLIFSDNDFDIYFNKHVSQELKQITRIESKKHKTVFDQGLPALIDKSLLTEK